MITATVSSTRFSWKAERQVSCQLGIANRSALHGSGDVTRRGASTPLRPRRGDPRFHGARGVYRGRREGAAANSRCFSEKQPLIPDEWTHYPRGKCDGGGIKRPPQRGDSTSVECEFERTYQHLVVDPHAAITAACAIIEALLDRDVCAGAALENDGPPFVAHGAKPSRLEP